MNPRKALAIGATSLAAAACLLAGGTPAQASPATPALAAVTLNATVALNNCSGSLVRWPSSVDTDRALLLTNGHCYEGGFINAGVVLQNRTSTRTGTLLNASGGALGTVRADKVVYATMTNTDVTLYELTDTYAALRTRTGVTALTVSAAHPTDATAISIPSSFWKQIWTCDVNGFVPTLKEDQWTWHDSIRYGSTCDTTHGTSGSPVIDTASGLVVGINNTGNDDGASCTLNNPCEVDAAGNVTVHQGQSYGEETYWFDTCLNASRQIDLTVSGCLLTKPAGTGNTVTVTNPGAQSGTVGVAASVQVHATDSAGGQTLTYAATGLPAGLSLASSTGLISGTPTAATTATVTVTARDTTGASGSATFTWTVGTGGGTCSGQALVNPGFESGATAWTSSSGVIGQNGAQQPAHAGTWDAWLDGYGSTHTDTLSQRVAIPAGCHATLSFWVHIDTAETTASTAFDKLTVAAGTSTLATLSNLDKTTGYGQKSYDISTAAGTTVTVTFTGVEDSSLQTSFVLDDTAVTLS